ncbi:MAG: hypothetical protein GYB67_03110 [Chloroflexi bacterium]|nr:hypothetical protein [Chloroflexota bacterium]
MRGFITFVVIIAVLLAGGGLTALLIANDGGGILPVLTTVNAPEASRTVVETWKAEQFLLMVGFIVFNLVGIGATLAVIFWFVDRGIKRTRAEAASAAAAESQVTARE